MLNDFKVVSIRVCKGYGHAELKNLADVQSVLDKISRLMSHAQWIDHRKNLVNDKQEVIEQNMRK